jgi:hypothetical protein
MSKWHINLSKKEIRIGNFSEKNDSFKNNGWHKTAVVLVTTGFMVVFVNSLNNPI